MDLDVVVQDTPAPDETTVVHYAGILHDVGADEGPFIALRTSGWSMAISAMPSRARTLVNVPEAIGPGPLVGASAPAARPGLVECVRRYIRRHRPPGALSASSEGAKPPTIMVGLMVVGSMSRRLGDWVRRCVVGTSPASGGRRLSPLSR